MSVPDFIAVHPIVVQIFQSGPSTYSINLRFGAKHDWDQLQSLVTANRTRNPNEANKLTLWRISFCCFDSSYILYLKSEHVISATSHSQGSVDRYMFLIRLKAL